LSVKTDSLSPKPDAAGKEDQTGHVTDQQQLMKPGAFEDVDGQELPVHRLVVPEHPAEAKCATQVAAGVCVQKRSTQRQL